MSDLESSIYRKWHTICVTMFSFVLNRLKIRLVMFLVERTFLFFKDGVFFGGVCHVFTVAQNGQTKRWP